MAAIADPETGFDVLDTYSQKSNGGWVTVGGTSLASPVVAAMWALAGGSGGTAYPASSLYVNGTVRPTGHYDVTAGGNSFCGGDTTTDCATVTRAPALNRECNATTGYDGPSGLGAPKGLTMFTPTSPKVSVTVPSARVHQSGTYRASVTERSTATQITGYTWVWGDGSSTKGTTASAHHTYSKAGTYTATLTVSDSRYQATVDRFRVKVAS